MRILLWNAFASILRAGSTSLVSILMPILLVLLMPVPEYAVWALIFGIASYTLYLDLGMQSTVQALVGWHDGAQDAPGAALVGRSALRIIGIVILVCLLGTGLISLVLTTVFPDIPSHLQPESRMVFVLVILGQTGSLAGTIAAAYFAGLQRGMEATAIIAPSRLISMVGAVVAAAFSTGLVTIAVFYCLPLLAGSLAIIWRFLRATRGVATRASTQSARTSPGYLLRYSGPLIVWNICMLVVYGSGIAITGRLDFARLAEYAIAATIVSGIPGVVSALLLPLLPELARRHTSSANPYQLGRIVLMTSQINGVMLACVSVALLAYAPVFLVLILGDSAGRGSFTILALLTAGNALRLIPAPLALAFVATSTHSKVIFPPIAEATVNLAGSIGFGLLFGAPGVALGFLAGGLTSVTLTTTWSVKKSGAVAVRTMDLLKTALFRPIGVVLPAVLAIATSNSLGVSNGLAGFALCTAGLLLSLPLVWLLGLPADTRKFVKARLSRVRI